MDKLPDELNTKQVCVALQISRTTLYRLIRQNVLLPIPRKTTVANSPLRFKKSDVARLLKPEQEH